MPVSASASSSTLPSTSRSALLAPRPACSTAGDAASSCAIIPPPAAWDLSAELNAVERRDRRRRGVTEKDSILMRNDGRKETKAERKLRILQEEEAFDQDLQPSAQAMFEASLYEVIDGDGASHMFGDLIRGQKTIVCFIRHWYCPLCQDFMYSIVQDVDPMVLEAAGVKLIIIGNGDPKVIHSYQGKVFSCPFSVYTDPTLELYRALGMTRQTGDGGSDATMGDYIKHTPLGGGLSVARNLVKMGHKGVTLKPGHFTQLGGEFVLGPGLAVQYAHRMGTTRGHNSIKIAMAHAGVVPGRKPRAPKEKQPQTEKQWQAQRDSELRDMQAWREDRRRTGRLYHAGQATALREVIPEVDDGLAEEEEEGQEAPGAEALQGRRPSAQRSFRLQQYDDEEEHDEAHQSSTDDLYLSLHSPSSPSGPRAPSHSRGPSASSFDPATTPTQEHFPSLGTFGAAFPVPPSHSPSEASFRDGPLSSPAARRSPSPSPSSSPYWFQHSRAASPTATQRERDHTFGSTAPPFLNDGSEVELGELTPVSPGGGNSDLVDPLSLSLLPYPSPSSPLSSPSHSTPVSSSAAAFPTPTPAAHTPTFGPRLSQVVAPSPAPVSAPMASPPSPSLSFSRRTSETTTTATTATAASTQLDSPRSSASSSGSASDDDDDDLGTFRTRRTNPKGMVQINLPGFEGEQQQAQAQGKPRQSQEAVLRELRI